MIFIVFISIILLLALIFVLINKIEKRNILLKEYLLMLESISKSDKKNLMLFDNNGDKIMAFKFLLHKTKEVLK